MFGFGNAVKLIKAAREYVDETSKPVRFYGYGNSLCQVGRAPWPPVIRNDSHHDFTDFFQMIAEALNIKHRYGFLRERMERSVAMYDRGDMSKMELADDLIKMLTVIKNDEKAEAPMFADHEEKLADYERSKGNWGG